MPPLTRLSPRGGEELGVLTTVANYFHLSRALNSFAASVARRSGDTNTSGGNWNTQIAILRRKSRISSLQSPQFQKSNDGRDRISRSVIFRHSRGIPIQQGR
jgi:hypothetical protein